MCRGAVDVGNGYPSALPGEHFALAAVGRIDPADQIELPEVRRGFPRPSRVNPFI
jgi:hypothetical protein